MRRTYVVMCCLISLLTIGTAYGFNANTDPSLVGLWKLDETEGTVALDSSPSGNNGTLNGNAAWAEGYLGGAISLDGTNSYIDVGASDVFNLTEQVTLALWIKPNDLNNGQHNHWLGKGDHAYAIKHNVNNNIEFFVYDAGDWHSVNYTGYDDSYNGEWHHMAGTYDGTAVTIYVDGIFGIEAAYSGGIAVSTHRVRIGENSEETGRYSDGVIDDARIYSRALTLEEIQAVMAGGGDPALASGPMPVVDAEDVWYEGSILEWIPGESAVAHDVYFGASLEDVNNANRNNDLSVLVSQGQGDGEYALGSLEFGQMYFWRVDEVNGAPDNTVFKGDVWSFTAEPYSIQIPGVDIIATASSASNEFSTAKKTIDGSGLAEDGTHSIASETMWFTAMGDTDAWIQYEFDGVKKLDTMKVWNSNSAAEGFIGYGVKGVEIAYSTDGETWNVLEDANELSRAPGLPTYDQPDEIAFDGVAAKMVRLNIQSNFGGFMQAYSLSEVQFNAIPAAVRQPEPVDGAADVFPNDMASWRAGRGAAQSIVYLSTDPNAVADGVAPSVTSNTNSLDFSSFDLQMGTPYYWRVDEVNNAEAVSVWAGPVWSFSVVAAVVVDDFESYGNDSPDRPFQVWLDGFGYSPDDFFPAGYNGNGTGAGIGHDIWSVSSDHFNGDIMETGSTIPGSSQSMPFYYGNSGGVASQTERTFAVSQDWTMGGAQTLSIPFSGQTGNTGTLYVKINNTKLTYPHGAANIAMSGWQAWNIDLTSMNVQNVTKLQIGVDGGSASGMILIDDITLHPTAGETVNPADPGTANLAGLWNFDAGSGSVVADSSGNGNNGTIEGGSNSWMPGKQGSALSMSINTYVSVPGAAWSSVSTEFTVSFWAKGDDLLADNWGFFAGNADDRIVSCHLPWGGEVIFDTTPGWNTERVIVGASDSELKGQWRHWTFVRNTETGEKQAYLDGLLYGSATPSADPIEDIDRFFIGAGDAGVSPYLGLIDEFQIYNRALSAGEVLWLSGNIAPVDKLF